MGNNRKKDAAKPAPLAAKATRKPLAPQLKTPTAASRRQAAAGAVSRPFVLPQFQELPKEERDIVLERIRKEVADASAALPAMRRFVARGVNHVARLIARRELRVVVLAANPDASAGAPFGHIQVLCRLHRVPICVLHLSSKAFGAVFQLPSLSVLGIKRLPLESASDAPPLSEAERERLQSIADFLVAKASSKNHALQ